jgi:hypothetical protein
MLTEIKHKTFTDESVEMDGKWFSDCHFIRCTLHYQGGEYGWERTTMHPGCVWKFDGPALRTVALLHSLKFLNVDFKDMGFSPTN